jgi:hypothetical protein
MLLGLAGLVCAPLGAQTNLNASMSASTMQTAINAAPIGTTVNFATGSYSLSAPLNGKCGLIYTGPVVAQNANGMYTATALLNSTFGQSNPIMIFNSGSGFAAPCTQSTIIEYLNFANSGGIYVQASYTNLTIIKNTFSNIPCCNGGDPANTGLYLDGSQSTSNTAQQFTNTLIQWNAFGDSASCLSPASAFADVTSADGDGNAAGCSGILINSSFNGITIWNNNFEHVSEGIHVLCPGGGHPGTGSQPCEPANNGAITDNLSAQFNDFGANHRIPFEEQPQTTSGVIFANNSIHDMNNPTAFSFGLSFACCASAGTSPYLNVSNNVVILNTAPVGRYGYGIEAWGKNATYNNNIVQAGPNAAAIAMAWGFGSVATMSNNTVCGNFSAYQADEGYGATPVPATTGNNNSSTCAATTSVAPTISPASGSYPLTVTLTDAGYASGAHPLGNTGIWCTTDGSSPVPGSGSSVRHNSGDTLVVSAPNLKCVGMWGARNQPTSYASGYGFTPSSVVSGTYTAGGVRSISSVTLTTGGNITALGVGLTNQATAKCSYSDGTTDNCVVSGNTVTWNSSSTGTATISTSGLITALAGGTTNLAASVTGHTSIEVPLTVSTLTSIAITSAAGSSLHAGVTSQFSATCTYANGFSDACNTIDLYGYTAAWASGTPATGTISGSGLFTALAAGTTAVHASAGVNSNTVTMTVTGATLSSIVLTATGGITTLPAIETVQLIATCHYSDSSVAACPASTWGSSAPSKAAVNSSGLVNTIAAGSVNFTTTIGAITSNTLAFTVTSATATLSGAYLGNAGNINTMAVGASQQFFAVCTYSDSSTDNCARVGGVTAWTTSNAAVMTMSALGLATGVGVGPPNSANAQATIGTSVSSPWTMFITPAPTLTGATFTLFGGITSIPVGAMVQGIVTCTYSDGTSDTCSGTADTRGNLAGSYTSSSHPAATIDSTGLVTPVASGSTTLGATVGSFTPTLAITVTGGSAGPTLVSAHQANTGSLNQFVIGGLPIQQHAICVYSDAVSLDCTFGDSRGSSVTSWTNTVTFGVSPVTVGAVGSASPGLVTPSASNTGSNSTLCVVTGGINCSSWFWTVTGIPRSGVQMFNMSPSGVTIR